ncbi:hypothetical protein BGZ96_008884 [Linnemannia gamsii]|uniref:Uncharacterized protein n=1 Tax=Linnemannia gamsii TaxID=64522 RepID=A0ABQ7JY34_9FUNG|nr:hypothetical protein BGZ96_008884 [Linnemannia gamsii]
MALKSKVLVVAGGITVLAVGAAVVAVATPALAVQAGVTVVYVLANGCFLIKEVISGLFSAGAIWYLWDYLRPWSNSNSPHRHRHESHLGGLVQAQPYHTGWEPDSIALSSRRTSFQSQHRGRPRSNSEISLFSDFELELPVSVFDTPRSPALAGTPFSIDARSRASSRSRSPASSGSASPAWTLDETTRSEIHGVTTIIDSYVQRGLRQRFSGV